MRIIVDPDNGCKATTTKAANCLQSEAAVVRGLSSADFQLHFQPPHDTLSAADVTGSAKTGTNVVAASLSQAERFVERGKAVHP